MTPRTTQEQWAHEECEDLPILKIKVVCAWCDKVLRDGNHPDVSHGICAKCAEELEEE